MMGTRTWWIGPQVVKEDLQAQFAYRQLGQELKEAGVFVSTEGSHSRSSQDCARGRRWVAQLADEIPETKEFLMGYWIVDVENAEEAYRVSRLSGLPAPAGTERSMPIEVRQVMSSAPEL